MRNYVELFIGRVNLGGNYFSFVGRDPDECGAKVDSFIQAFGGSVDFKNAKAYVLLNKENVYGLVNVFLSHDTSAWGSSWAFLQDGLKATKSPRDSWSHGE